MLTAITDFSLGAPRIAIGAALFLAIPFITFISALVVFPLALYAMFAIVANAGFVIMAAAALLQWADVRLPLAPALIAKWRDCSIIWAGMAFSISRWGDVASSMGAKNTPFLDVLFAPLLYLAGLQPL